MKMQRVTVREISADAERYLSGEDTLVVEQDGRPIGYYVPIRESSQQDASAAFERLERTVQHVLAETGLTEEELSRLFDLSVPIPEKSTRRQGNGHSAS
jgi:hypothetical protein